MLRIFPFLEFPWQKCGKRKNIYYGVKTELIQRMLTSILYGLIMKRKKSTIPLYSLELEINNPVVFKDYGKADRE
jgi:uncharacterized protein YehS (DUF1456 family)